jgi:alkanesulfonate monooxygenase SsuD/methylene tetrahydromethanopterin reductase-like flavin-dependent oxidoreductase (luciferase family)
MPAPAVGELPSLLEYLRYQHQAFDVTSYGLTDEQARCTPTASSLCIGGLIKHVTTMEYAWTQQVLAPPGLAQDPWSLEGMMVTWAHREEQFVMRDDDTFDGLLQRLTAQNAATMGLLDILSNGRLDVAVAVGYRRREAEGYGVDFSKRGSRTDEFLDIVLRLWMGKSLTFNGKHFQLKNAKITPAPPKGRIPLYLGGFNEKAIERTAKFGDGYFGNMEFVDLYHEKLRAQGKDPSNGRIRIQGLFVVAADDPERAMDELAPFYLHVNNSYGQWLNEAKESTGMGDKTMLKPMALEQFKASRILQILTPAQAIDLFNKMRATAPVEHFMMMLPPGIPTKQFAKYAETFAKDVIPAFR